MKKLTANSVSGGKSSAYIAAHYPSDIEIFSLVCADDYRLSHPDKKLMQMANDRLSNYTERWGEFIGTTEDPIIIKTIFDLEQHIGREIVWVRGESFDSIIDRKSMIPNKLTRFCTDEMKLKPIFEYFYLNHDLEAIPLETPKFSKERPYLCKNPIEMKIGYRYDEKERCDRFSTDFEIATQCANYGEHKMRNKIFKNWRTGRFDLVDNGITVFPVQKYWKDKDVEFAIESNCNNCFWKPWQKLQQLYHRRPALRDWTRSKEIKLGHTFHSDLSVDQIINLPIQTGLFDVGFYCNSGNCHD
ncbi:phosphoadenosine phosphosulfate reductase family protein [Cyclobacterium sediminis]